jgi:hypothetical protein
MQSEGKDAKGRNFDQVTKDGTGSIASVGAGGTGATGDTGDTGAIGTQHNDWGHSDVGSGNRQSGSRTDDLLAPAADQEQRQGFIPGEEAGELQTGLGGTGSLSTGNAGNRQSEGESQPGGQSGSMQSGDKGNASVPESGGQRTKK